MIRANEYASLPELPKFYAAVIHKADLLNLHNIFPILPLTLFDPVNQSVNSPDKLKEAYACGRLAFVEMEMHTTALQIHNIYLNSTLYSRIHENLEEGEKFEFTPHIVILDEVVEKCVFIGFNQNNLLVPEPLDSDQYPRLYTFGLEMLLKAKITTVSPSAAAPTGSSIRPIPVSVAAAAPTERAVRPLPVRVAAAAAPTGSTIRPIPVSVAAVKPPEAPRAKQTSPQVSAPKSLFARIFGGK